MQTSLNWICRSGRECSDTLAQALGEMEAAEESECTRGKQVRETSRDKIASTREESKLFASTSAQLRPLVLVRGPCRTPRWPQRERQRRQWTVREPVRGCGCL